MNEQERATQQVKALSSDGQTTKHLGFRELYPSNTAVFDADAHKRRTGGCVPMPDRRGRTEDWLIIQSAPLEPTPTEMCQRRDA